MRRSIYKNTLPVLLLFGCFAGICQKKYDLKREVVTMSLAGKSLTGYKTSFDFSVEEVRKGWWRYAKKFGSPLDMRTHYEVKIPSETTDGNVDLVIYSETVQEDGVILFKVGLEDSKYKVQVEELIQEFKKDFYIQHYLAELRLIEIEAEQLSNSYSSSSEEGRKNQLLTDLKVKKVEMELLKDEVRKIEQM